MGFVDRFSWEHNAKMGIFSGWAFSRDGHFLGAVKGAGVSVDRVFGGHPLKFSSADNYEKCVPRKDEQPLY
jgi:hypothetical protein